MRRIYLDYAASTPVDKRVLKFALKSIKQFGNPGSIHYFGQKAISLLDWARNLAADFFSCRESEIIFTSSATESNNLVLRGTAKYFQQTEKDNFHIISTEIEHKSVLNTLRDLEKQSGGKIKISYAKPNKFGKIEVSEIISLLRENTVLISIMAANNETGVIQPVKEISQILENQKNIFGFRPILHSDATQYVQYLEKGVSDLGADLISFSGHKIYALKGVGGLFIKTGINISPITIGGDQEYGLRAGTENIFGILSLAKALEIIKKEGRKEKEKIEKLADYFLEKIKENFPEASLNSGKEKIVPHILNISFPGQKSDELLVRLDLAGVAISAGSACSSRILRPSHVLLAQGFNDNQARSSIRFSFGRLTTKKEIEKTIKILKKIFSEIKK